MLFKFLKIISIWITFLRLNVSSHNYSYYDENYGKTWMYIPDGNGVPQVAYLTPPPLGRADAKGNEVKDHIRFELYTREHSRQPKTLRNFRKKREDLDEFNSYFQPNAETKIVIHGWLSSSSSDTVQNIKEAYLRQSDMNVIAVDWQGLASNLYYLMPATHTKEIGRYTAELIDYLVRVLHANSKNIHIIGHSLGAHIAGFAGSYVRSGKIPRITGLDPAMPGFDGAEINERLDWSDAKFVDVIHSCGGVLGILHPIGHVDFYPNGGFPMQPGCNGYTEVVEACSHGRSHKFFAESIYTDYGFYGHQCDSWEAFVAGNCPKASALMGDNVPTNARGQFYLRTSDSKPFALGFV